MNIMRKVMVTVVLGATVLLAADAGASVMYDFVCEDVICDQYAGVGRCFQFSDETVMDAETYEGAEYVEEFQLIVA